MFNKIKLISFFIVIFVFIVSLLYSFSNNYFIDNYVKIEDIHNEKNIKDFIKNLNIQFDHLNNTLEDYSKKDNVYNFLKNSKKNKNFLYENFRNENALLTRHNIEYFFYLDKNEQIKALLAKEELKKDKYLINKIIHLLKNRKMNQIIFDYKDKFYYAVKAKVTKTDGKGDYVGDLFIVKSLENRIFNYANSSFSSVKIIKTEKIEDFTKSTIFFNDIFTIKYKIHKEDNTIFNYLELSDYHSNYIATIKATLTRDYVIEGKKSVVVFNFLISLALIIVLYMIYTYQSFLQIYAKKLEKSVSRRTDELERSNKELHELAYKDYLTKIDNRRSFFMKIEKILNDKLFKKDLVHIVMIDIDNFKQINDKYGHDIGDVVLKEFSKILKKNTSYNDLYARLGGEEFVVAISDLDTNEVVKKIENIRSTTENTKVKVLEDKYINFTASFGIADNKKTRNIDKILHKADSYLYEVKKSGKNNIRYRNK